VTLKLVRGSALRWAVEHAKERTKEKESISVAADKNESLTALQSMCNIHKG
jgi:hypothetical protein